MFKEFFTGSKQVQDARVTVDKYSGISNLSARQQNSYDSAKTLTRRHALKLAASGIAVSAAAVIGGASFLDGTNNEGNSDLFEVSILPNDRLITRPIFVKEDLVVVGEKDKSRYDAEYIKRLLSDLESTKKLNSSDTWDAIRNNVAFVELIDPGGPNTTGMGTALRICESGYYFTAAHLFSSNGEDVRKSPVNIYLPSTGEIAKVKDMTIDFNSDLALIHAPTGKKTKKIDGLKISRNDLVPGNDLWMIGLSPVRVNPELWISHGQVDENPRVAFVDEDILLAVKGMAPFGGASGGPIIDKGGTIVGVLSGALSSPGIPVQTRLDYTHGTISPLSNLSRLEESSVIPFS